MTRRLRNLLRGAAALVVTVAVGSLLPSEASGVSIAQDNPSADSALGERLFFKESFGGNGRTCATCHVPESEYALTPDAVRAVYARDPNDPLFRPIDSDDGNGRDYTSLLQHALVNVEVPLASNVTLVDEPTRRTIVVRRAVPSIVNVALTAPYQLDGRAPTLEAQAALAIAAHFEPTDKPNGRELTALARFEAGVFEPQRLSHGAAQQGSAGFSMPVSNPAALQGRAVYQRLCAPCHGGETGSVPSPNNGAFVDIAVSRANRLQLPLLRLAFRGADGTVTIVQTPDPGRAAVTGKLSDLNAFDIPALRGIKHTAPYFHDNSAATLYDVIDHYNQFLGMNIGFRDRDALVAFLESL